MKENEKIVIRRIGQSFRDSTALVACDRRAPQPGEILVRNHFAGVNGVYDQMMCLDRVEHTRVVPPADTGVEAIGVVEAVGDGVTGFAPGDAVVSVNVGHGYRLWQTQPGEDLIGVSAVDPAILALIPSGVSALIALEQVGEMKAGETV